MRRAAISACLRIAKSPLRHVAGMVQKSDISVRLGMKPDLVTSRRLSIEYESERPELSGDITISKTGEPSHQAATTIGKSRRSVVVASAGSVPRPDGHQSACVPRLERCPGLLRPCGLELRALASRLKSQGESFWQFLYLNANGQLHKAHPKPGSPGGCSLLFAFLTSSYTVQSVANDEGRAD